MTCNRYWNLNDSTCSGVMLMNSRTPPFPEKRPNYLFGRCHCKNNTPEKDAHMEDLLDHDLRQKLIDEKVLKVISIWTQCLKGRQKVECCQRCKDLVRNRNGGLSNSHPSVIQLSAHLFIFRSQSCPLSILHLLEVHFFIQLLQFLKSIQCSN